MPRNTPAPEKAARCPTRASIRVCGSAQAWPQMIPSPGRITLARSTIGAIMTDEKCLDVILREARTHNVFTDRPVSDATLRQAHELMKWGPTSANSQPGRRSEEHTSELQSQSNLVCRLLLEKKKET